MDRISTKASDKRDSASKRPVRGRRGRSYGMLPGLVGYQLRRAQQRVFQDLAAILSAHSLTPGQFGVLTLIDANAGLNQSQLGAAMGVDRSTVVAVIDRLEKAGLVVREPSPNDRRSYALQLSPHGNELLARLRPQVIAHENVVAARFSDSEKAKLLEFLERLTRGG